LRRDDGAAVRLHELADYPTTGALTPDRRFAWVEDKEGSGGVFRTSDGAHVTSFSQFFDGQLEDGMPWLENFWFGIRPYEAPAHEENENVDENENEDVDEHEDVEDPLRAARQANRVRAAIAVHEGRVLTYRAGMVSRNGVPWFGIGMAVDAAAFDRTGERLAFHTAGEPLTQASLAVLDLRGDEPQVAYHRVLRG
jgi:hypothetical protein